MEIYSETIVTKEELELDEINTEVESYKLQAKLLNSIKEALELTEYTTEENISYNENGNKKASTVINYLEDSAIINAALFYFIKLINNPMEIIEDLSIINPNVEECSTVEQVIDLLILNDRTSTLIRAFERAVEKGFSEEEVYSSIKKEQLLEKKLRIERELTELEAKK